MKYDPALQGPPAGSADGGPETSEFPLRLTEVFWVAAAGGLVAAQATRLASASELWQWPAVLLAPLLVLLAMPMADLISGMIHWTFDTWGNGRTFFIGPRLIHPFRVHHDRPRNLLGTHFITTNADAALANIPILLLVFAIPLSGWVGPAAALFLVATAVWGLPTSQIHKWAHCSHPPRFVIWLQRRGLILGQAHHAAHHAPPHTVNYCITFGWCNTPLRRLGIFPKLEWVVSLMTGWKPRRDHADDYDEAGRPSLAAALRLRTPTTGPS